ncbi:hypothetical protein PAXRUDRAFT_145606, partial [Paxillus rubicundulus Ve08.2h10]
KQQNHISPVLMEVLQMSKFFLKKDHLQFMEGWVTQQHEMLRDKDDDDLLAQVVDIGLNPDKIMEVVDDVMVVIGEDEGDILVS